jgi:hypothetical protein
MRRPVGVKLILHWLRETTFVLPPSGRCRHASIRTLEERFVSLGACWAFSVQPVLPSVWRPVVLLLPSGTWARRLTQSPELGFGFYLFSSWNVFDFVLRFCFTRLLPLSFCCYCATDRRLRRSPTSDATTPPAFAQSPRWLVSFRFFHRARPTSDPSV